MKTLRAILIGLVIGNLISMNVAVNRLRKQLIAQISTTDAITQNMRTIVDILRNR